MSASAQPSTELLLARRTLSLSKREAELRRENGLLFYTPHEKQYSFHSSSARFRHGRFANQTGKSEMGAVEDLSFALGFRPFMERKFDILNGKREVVGVHDGYDGHPLATQGIPQYPTVGLIIAQDWEKSKEIFTELEGTRKGKLFTYLPSRALLSTSRNHSGAIDCIRIRHRSGGTSVIRIDTVKSYKQDPQALESSIWDWIHVDEPCPEGMFKASARGLMARNGRAWLNLTPLTEPWIQDMFWPNAEQLSDELESVVSGDKEMFFANMFDNPYLDDDGRQAYISLLTKDEQICRVQGIPAAYSGIVYKEFKEDIHVRRDPPPGWSDWATPPPTFTRRFAIDYHPRKPHHVLFIATDEFERQYVYAEIFLSCLMSELVQEIKTTLKGESTVPGLIDPLADTPNRVTDITPLEEVLRLGLPVVPATKDPHNGILKVKELLSARDRLGRPMLYVNPLCKRFRYEIARGFMWDGETNKPVKKDDDAMENFYRLCLQGLSYIEHEASSLPPNVIPLRDLGDTTLDFSILSDSSYDFDAKPKIDTKKRYRA